MLIRSEEICIVADGLQRQATAVAILYDDLTPLHSDMFGWLYSR